MTVAVRQQEVLAALPTPAKRIPLHEQLPAWEVAADQTIVRANLLILWLWELLPVHFPEEQVDLRGLTTSDVFARNVNRIPKTSENESFWETKFKILYHLSGEGPSPLRDVYNQDQWFRAIWDNVRQKGTLEGIKEYNLNITPPFDESNAEILAFRPQIAPVADVNGKRTGYLAVYEVDPFSNAREATYGIIRQKYKELKESGYPYVLNLSGEGGAANADLKERNLQSQETETGSLPPVFADTFQLGIAMGVPGRGGDDPISKLAATIDNKVTSGVVWARSRLNNLNRRVDR